MNKVKKLFINYDFAKKPKNTNSKRIRGLIYLFGNKEVIISIDRDYGYINNYYKEYMIINL